MGQSGDKEADMCTLYQCWNQHLRRSWIASRDKTALSMNALVRNMHLYLLTLMSCRWIRRKRTFVRACPRHNTHQQQEIWAYACRGESLPESSFVRACPCRIYSSSTPDPCACPASSPDLQSREPSSDSTCSGEHTFSCHAVIAHVTKVHNQTMAPVNSIMTYSAK